MKNDATRPYIIAVTGTKGKTTTARLLSYALCNMGYYTLLVDSDGHYVNNKQKSTANDSRKLSGLLPTSCPGRYLYELDGHENSIAVLETGIFSSGSCGTGFLRCDIGIFTNVYDDHIGATIRSRQGLANAKARVVVSNINENGLVVFNADDDLVVNAILKNLPANFKGRLIPVSVDAQSINNLREKISFTTALFLQNDSICVLKSGSIKPIMTTKEATLTFGGSYLPSIYNLMFAAAAIIGSDKRTPSPLQIGDILSKYRPRPGGSRLHLVSDKQRQIKIIIDNAHEKKSLAHIADLARRMSSNKTIGVIRLDPDRVNKSLLSTARAIANKFDVLIIYDKLDGVSRKLYSNPHSGITRKAGEVSHLVFNEINQYRTSSHRVYRKIEEQQAIRLAISSAREGDVIVHISNDDTEKSWHLVKQALAF